MGYLRSMALRYIVEIGGGVLDRVMKQRDNQHARVFKAENISNHQANPKNVTDVGGCLVMPHLVGVGTRGPRGGFQEWTIGSDDRGHK